MNERVSLNERGSGLVELALVLPVVLVLTLAIVQFGVLGFAASAADNAARQGARIGSVAQVNPAGQAVAEAQQVAVATFSIGQPQVVALAPGGVVGSELDDPRDLSGTQLRQLAGEPVLRRPHRAVPGQQPGHVSP